MLVSTACFDSAPQLASTTASTTGDASSTGASATDPTSATSGGVEVTSSADTTTDAPSTCPGECTPAIVGWEGPHLLRLGEGECPPGTNETQDAFFEAPLCACSCKGFEDCAQSFTAYGDDDCITPVGNPESLDNGAENNCVSPPSIYIQAESPTTTQACTAGAELSMTWCDTQPCEGGRCAVPDPMGETFPFGRCVWCDSLLDVGCGTCPAGFPERFELRGANSGPWDCPCCSSLDTNTVCSGLRNGCLEDSPALPLGGCEQVDGDLGYFAARPICKGPPQGLGGFVACCEARPGHF